MALKRSVEKSQVKVNIVYKNKKVQRANMVRDATANADTEAKQ
jgi:hypothetical protein